MLCKRSSLMTLVLFFMFISTLSWAEVTVSTIAGSGSAGGQDGVGTAASFYSPHGIAVDTSGNLYVADASNHKIRKITLVGVVTTIAGSGSLGSQDGVGAAASFYYPHDIATDAAGNLYVADMNNNKIRKITPTGVVTTIAGSGSPGSQDGVGAAASFYSPSGIAVDTVGNIYVVDYNSHKIRKTTLDGVVTTVAGTGSPGGQDGVGTAASFYWPRGITIDTAKNLYVTDLYNHKIRKITPTGVVTTIAGSGSIGSQDGVGTTASFYYPHGIAIDAAGNLYVTDTYNRKIRKITPAGVVTTIAGTGSIGSQDGVGVAASFDYPVDITVDESGNLYIADSGNHKIRKITMSSNIDSYQLNITTNNSSYGSVSGYIGNSLDAPAPPPPSGVSSMSGTSNFPKGSSVILIANPSNADYWFSGWSGDANGTQTKILVTMDGTKNITANFVVKDGYQLSINTTDNSYGSMVVYRGNYVDVPIPSGLQPLSDNDLLNLSKNSIVTLVANPKGSDYQVVWSGDASGYQNKIAVTMDRAKSITANFKLKDGYGYPLNVTTNNSSYGSVSIYRGNHVSGDSPPPPAGGTTPTMSSSELQNITKGSVVTLVANPSSPNYWFAGWGGDASGTKSKVLVTMNGAKNITANFVVKDGYQLSVSTTKSNYGSLSIYRGDYSEASLPVGALPLTDNDLLNLSRNSIVTLVANPKDSDYQVVWSGDASGTQNKIAVTMDRAKSITANFKLKDGYGYPLNITTVNSSYGNVSVYMGDYVGTNGVDAPPPPPAGTPSISADELANLPKGSVVTLFTNPASLGYWFAGWDGDANGTQSKIAVTMNGAKNIIANFASKINNLPIANFSVSTASGAAPLTVYFQNSSTDSDGQVVGYSWSFGDGTTSIEQNPAKTYTSAGNYMVTLTATDDKGAMAIKNVAMTIKAAVSTETVTTFAGTGSPSSIDGIRVAAGFYYPTGVAIDSNGNMFIADNGNHKIRKITSSGVVTTFAGSGSIGSNNGKGIEASFYYPFAITVGRSGNLFVTDTENNKIRKITPEGIVTTFAGSGSIGSNDGVGTAASFNSPQGITIDSAGNLFVTDRSNHKIRKITPEGIVTTIAGTGSAGSRDDIGLAASFNYPFGITVDGGGNIFVADTWNHKIRKITPLGTVTTIAGASSAGNSDGVGLSASFNYPFGVTIDGTGNLFVSDTFNNKIRKITSTGIVSTVAGSGSQGGSDGIGLAASFYRPRSVAVDSSGSLFVADSENNKIRKITISAASAVPLSAATYELKIGWNMVSSLFSNKRISTSTFVKGGASGIYAYDVATNSYIIPSFVEPTKGYWVSMSKDATIQINDNEMESSTAQTLELMMFNTVINKWNLQGTFEATTKTAVKAMGASVVWWYDPAQKNYSTDETIKAGSGFWLKKSPPPNMPQ